jgi:outer membrane protein assembly factor BamB
MWSTVMTERDPLLALRGLIDEPIAPRAAFADELRARLLTELASHRPPAIDEDRMMEITTPGLNLVVPHPRERRPPHWRTFARFAAALLVLFSVIAAFASERAGGPETPKPTMEANLGIFPPSSATPDPNTVTALEADSGVLWKVPTGSEKTPLAEVVPANGTAYFLEQSGYLYAVDSASGELRWKANAGSNWGVAVDDSGAYVTARLPGPDTSTRLLKYDLTTGQEIWRVSLGEDVSSQPMLNNGIAYVWDGQNYLYAVDTETGTELWRRHSADTPDKAVDLSAFNQTALYRPDALLDTAGILVITSDGQLGRITLDDAESGEWEWRAQLENRGERVYVLASTADTVATVSLPTGADSQAPNSLIVFDRESGRELWRNSSKEFPGLLLSDGDGYIVSVSYIPEVATPTSSVPITSSESRKYNARTGEVEWTAEKFIPRAVTPDGSIAVSFLGDGFITLADTKTGRILGSAYPFGVVYGTYGLTNDTLFGIRADGALIAIDLNKMKNGKLPGGAEPPATPEGTPSPESDSALLWQTEPVENLRSVGQPVASNGAIYRLIYSKDFSGVEAFDAATGDLTWRHAVEGTSIVADEGGVYVTLNAHNTSSPIFATPGSEASETSSASVVALDPQTGEERWSIDTGTSESRPALRDGTLYFIEDVGFGNVAQGMTQEATAIDVSDGSAIWSQTVGVPAGDDSWITSLAMPPNSMVVGDSVLVMHLGNGALIGLDRATGEKRWEHQGFDPLNFTVDLRISGSTVIAAVYGRGNLGLSIDGFSNLQSKSAVIAYNLEDGTPLWGYDTGDMPSNLAVANGIAVVTAAPSAVPELDPPVISDGARKAFSWVTIGIDTATGEFAWMAGGGGGPEESRSSIVQSVDSPVIYQINPPSSFAVIDPGTGNSASSPLNFGQAISGAPVADGDHVYIQLKDGTIAAATLPVPATQTIDEQLDSLMPPTGDPLPDNVVWHTDQDIPWPREMLGFGLDAMTVADDRIYRTSVVITDLEAQTTEQVLEAFDAQTGQRLWQIPVTWPGTFRVGDSLAAGNGSVFVVVNTSENPDEEMTSWDLVAFDGANGDEQWRQSFTNDQGIEAITFIDDVLYTATTESAVTAYDATTGQPIWTSSAPPNNTITIPSEPITEGTISEDNESSPAGSEPAIAKHDDRLYVVTTSGKIAVLDAQDGSLIGSADPGSTESTTKPVFMGDLMIVGNTESGTSIDGLMSVGRRGTLTAFDVTDNYSIAWQMEVGRSADNVVAIGDELYVTVGMPDDPDNTVVVRFNPEDGGLIWTSQPLGRILLLRSTDDSPGSLVAQSISDGVLYTLDRVTGDITATSEHFPAIAIEAGDNGSSYYATLLDGTLAAISVEGPVISHDQLMVTAVATQANPESTASPEAIAWHVGALDSPLLADGSIVAVNQSAISAG